MSNVRIRLVDDFRFIHEPLQGMSDGEDFALIGREELIARLAHRIARTNGGCFLIAGYRGVGKTTLVNATVARVEELLSASGPRSSPAQTVAIRFSLPKPVSAAQLMYQLIAALKLELERRDLFAGLDRRLREELDTAVLRTVASLSRTAQEESELSLRIVPELLAGCGKTHVLGEMYRKGTSHPSRSPRVS